MPLVTLKGVQKLQHTISKLVVSTLLELEQHQQTDYLSVGFAHITTDLKL